MTESALTIREARREARELLRRDASFEQNARDVLDLGMRYLDVENGHLTRIDQETNHWKALVSTDSADGRIPPGLELDLGTTYCRRTIAADSPVALHDVPNQGWADDPAFETHEHHCYHGTPLLVDGEPYGTVCFVAENPRRERFSDVETTFTELISRLLERELERERYEAELRRQTNLVTVLNRVLRHNLRNDMTVVRGHIRRLVDEPESEPPAEIALDHIEDLLELSRKARDLNRVIDADSPRELTDVVALVEGTVERITSTHPSAVVSLECDSPSTAAVLPSFERAVEEILENAVKHSGESPTVEVDVEPIPNAVEIRVTDDGPGLAAHEADVLETGSETPLAHGSGLGLWLARWIVTSHGGTIEATDSGGGTTVTISVPRTSATVVHGE